jgi:glycosyltransferase involved in cell wall biosynthesis
MRIGFVVHKLPPESLGGTEVYTRSLARALAAQGHSVSIFAPSSHVAQPQTLTEADGVAVTRVPLPPSRATENAAAQFWHTVRDRTLEAYFAEYLLQARPDVVHFQHVQGVSARLIELAAGRPRFATLHDYWYFCANSQLVRPDRSPCSGPSAGCRNCVDCATARADLAALRTLRPLVALPLAWRNQMLRAAVAQIDRFFAPSAFLRDFYVGQGFEGARIQVIENGMDLTRLQVGADAAPPTKRGLRVGFLGTLAWQKGAHVLVDAFNQLPANVPATLTLHGSGEAFPDYAATLRASVHHPKITLLPPVPYDDVGRVLRTFDVLVVPSLWYENSPLVIQEAYALGIPVIASNLGALTEKVIDGRTGALFAPGDAAALAACLQEVITQPDLLSTWRRQIVPPPAMEEHAAALTAIYSQYL